MNLAVTGQEAWEWFRGAPLKILITLVAAVIVRALLVRAGRRKTHPSTVGRRCVDLAQTRSGRRVVSRGVSAGDSSFTGDAQAALTLFAGRRGTLVP